MDTATADAATATGPPDVGSLYSAHRLALVRLAILLVDDLPSAEDVVQDAFAELARHPDRLRDPGAAFGYLRTSVVNRSRSALRRRRTARSYVAPAATDAPAADEQVVLAEEHATLLAAVRRLAPRQREVLVLRYWSDLSEAEIAETCGTSRGSVKSTASRALAALERNLSEQS
jgi:RNA polymerase sigma-70 factor (sigma-E family)